MDVIGFLYLSLGSSTVQLHDSLDSRRACPVPTKVSVVKMAAVLVECATEQQRFLLVIVGKRTQCKGCS
jgi:hypothetical protein